MTASPAIDTIRSYWNERAASHPTSPTATTNDVYLRQLEAKTLIRSLGEIGVTNSGCVLDIGCGDGRTTHAISTAYPRLSVTGIDYSPDMIAAAQSHGSPCRFSVGDVLDAERWPVPKSLDCAITVRCLINLPDADSQGAAFANIAQHLRPGGYYLAIENFHEGQTAMNAARALVGLPPIEVRWHNRFFTESEFESLASPYFQLVKYDYFSSSYYFATRVIYSKMCAMRGEEPDYQHDIHKLAVDLPSTGNYSPIRLAILKKR